MSGVSESANGGLDNAALLSGATAQDFTNANTITKWLLSKPAESQPQVAQALFEKLLQDASQSRQQQNSGQACVRLCGFVQQCAKSSDEALKRWAFTEVLSLKLFHFYLEWYEHDPLRALRLVLDFLAVSSNQNPCKETGRLVREHILETLVSIITRKYPRLLIKSGLQCLDHLLTKQAIQLDDIAHKYRELEPSLAGETSISLFKSLVFHLFSWMELTYVSPLAGKITIHIFRGLDDPKVREQASGPDDSTVNTWLGWVRDGLVRSPAILDDIRNYVLVPIFKTDKASSLALLQIINRSESLTISKHESSDQAFMLQLAVLELGKRFGLVEEPMTSEEIPEDSNLVFLLQKSILDSFLSHPSVPVRSSAFSLLVSSQATTKPYSQTAFALLRQHLAPFHTDYDARFRNEVLGLTKNLIRRVKNVITVAQRSLAFSADSSHAAASAGADPNKPAPKKKFGPEAQLKDDAEATEVRTRHEEFLSWYLDFLKGELLPTVSYQRHVTALKATLLTIRLGKHAGAGDEFDVDIGRVIASDPSCARLLFDLILDPFDDVRDGACVLLGLLPQDLLVVPSQDGDSVDLRRILGQFCNNAQALANRTGRADHGDGAARSKGLLCKWLGTQEARLGVVEEALGELEGKVEKAERDLGHAAIENPVHGEFAAISYMWQVLASETYSTEQLGRLDEVYRRVLGCSRRIWAAVKHVLCDDSPEGHLPEEMEEIEGLDTKDLLSYSFRAVHESSNLLRLMVGTLRLEAVPGVPFPPLDVFKDAGYLTFEQLASLRHRGAFSTVSLTFATCCQLTQRLPRVYDDITGSDNLLREWYQGALVCIVTQASTTRRSAGIPDLISAVLSANAQTPSFDEIFKTLREMAEKPARVAETDGSNLPQVHALNCLRGVFRSSLLSKKAENYLAENLQLASHSLRSEVWAIRNCGLLLLRSLIDCLLGTGESKATMESGWDGTSVRISYNKYPTLPGVILGLLQSADTAGNEVSSAAAEAVFPALDIIRRAGPPDEHREKLRGYIEGYLGSKIWLLREIAARTLCSFFLQADWVVEIRKLLGGCGNDANRLHGVLMTARFVLERKIDLGYDPSSDAGPLKSLLGDISQKTGSFRHCPDIQAAYLEILNLLSRHRWREVSLLGYESAVEECTSRPSALLDMQIAIKLAADSSGADDLPSLRTHILTTLSQDINTACRTLESLPSIWSSALNKETRTGFCTLYADICAESSAPDVRSQALSNLTDLMDEALQRKELADLPGVDTLERVWKSLQQGEINPTLSYSIIRASGTFMAALSAQGAPDLSHKLRSWGVMIADALDIDNSFDTRYAAGMSLKGFFLGYSETNGWDDKYLPALSALYDCLIDDDDEVREVAATAAAGVLGSPLVPPVAADRLVAWMGSHYGSQAEFQQHVVYRVTGQTPRLQRASGFQLVSAEEQVLKAMEFDDALFATEEQNLFIDEVRETGRWRRAFCDAEGVWDGEAFGALKRWTEEGLACLIRLAEKEDGALGWTSDQHAFAACARIVLCAVAILRKGEDKAIRELLDGFVRTAKVHGSLLEMAIAEI
ncbi:putative death-receptor fusion protein-domain-containing protein [Cercophora newfieldiana]|uniref:Death-receptor fusion protein-domain-containing protein n=1 Tax=Cercophora newfieldiana TaxID=92897 RepID=A0AA39Y5N3_9PEZI|nr:putative death-receptor fusion protein-domain-containing protein [Cercophora newfieldiana]